MADVRIESEEEIDSGWRFSVRIAPAAATEPAKVIALTMSWAEYDRWSSGTEPPCDIAREVMERLIAHRTVSELPDRFDASTIPRWLPDIDEAMRRLR